MKKIGVLTYWSSVDNYGQILQCYALQNYLNKNGCDTFLIKFKPTTDYSLPYRVLKKLSIKRIVEKAKRILTRDSLKLYDNIKSDNAQLDCGFDKFRECYINSTEKIYTSIKELRKEPPACDVYICGSDQIWYESYYNRNVGGWFLQFGEAKRVSYAPSIGRKVTDKRELRIMKSYLCSFDAISVREESAKYLLNTMGIPEAQVVVDPTLLLNKDDYLEIAEDYKNKEEPYVLIYILNIKDKSEIDWDSIEKFLEKNNLKARVVMSSGYYPVQELIPNHKNERLSVNQWIDAINNAEYVITTSFHGTVFSVLMNKKFVVFPLRDFKGANDRISTLLNKCNLEKRIVEQFSEEIISQEIDWNTVNEKLEQYKKASFEFINKNILS